MPQDEPSFSTWFQNRLTRREPEIGRIRGSTGRRIPQYGIADAKCETSRHCTLRDPAGPGESFLAQPISRSDLKPAQAKSDNPLIFRAGDVEIACVVLSQTKGVRACGVRKQHPHLTVGEWHSRSLAEKLPKAAERDMRLAMNWRAQKLRLQFKIRQATCMAAQRIILVSRAIGDKQITEPRA